MITTPDTTTQALTRLAQGTLESSERLALAQRALRDPAFALELKLALRLADASAELTRDWVAVAQRAPAAHGVQSWWRPLAGVTASLAIVAAVMVVPRPQGSADAPQMVASHTLPDRIGSVSFETDSLGGGGFEAD